MTYSSTVVQHLTVQYWSSIIASTIEPTTAIKRYYSTPSPHPEKDEEPSTTKSWTGLVSARSKEALGEISRVRKYAAMTYHNASTLLYGPRLAGIIG